MTLNGITAFTLRYFIEFVYDDAAKTVHVRYLISWWVSCFNRKQSKTRRAGLKIH